MKKLIVVCTVLVVVMVISCNNSESPDTNKQEGNLFPAPLSVKTTTNAVPPYIYILFNGIM